MRDKAKVIDRSKGAQVKVAGFEDTEDSSRGLMIQDFVSHGEFGLKFVWKLLEGFLTMERYDMMHD